MKYFKSSFNFRPGILVNHSDHQILSSLDSEYKRTIECVELYNSKICLLFDIFTVNLCSQWWIRWVKTSKCNITHSTGSFCLNLTKVPHTSSLVQQVSHATKATECNDLMQIGNRILHLKLPLTTNRTMITIQFETSRSRQWNKSEQNISNDCQWHSTVKCRDNEDYVSGVSFFRTSQNNLFLL